MSLNNYKDLILKTITPILDECNFNLFELNFVNDYESLVLQILVENKDSSKKFVEFDDLVKANEQISEKLDNLSELSEPYILEVASAGIERTIKSKESLIQAVPNHVFVETQVKIETTNEFTGDLVEYDSNSDSFMFKFFLKGKPKKVKLKWEEINFIRYAVKF